MVSVTINGRHHEFEAKQSLLHALQLISIKVPALCKDPRLEPLGSCRLCMVRVKGLEHLQAACTTAVTEGMVVKTHTPELEAGRRAILRLLAENYPQEAVRRFPEKEFHVLIRQYGLEKECRGTATRAKLDESNPYFRADMSQCILCYRCVGICEDVQGQFVWGITNRGDASRILPDSGTTLWESSCVSCGACVDTCPTGALEDKSILSMGTPTRWTKSTCAYCGTGCELEVGVREDRIVAVKPALEAPVNRGHLCVKGRYANEYVYAADRVMRPMVREGGEWRTVSWEEAITFAAGRLRQIGERYGPDSIGVLGSARATNEENYLTQKFARIVAGTNNVDCCARVCHAPSAAAMKLMLGTGAATNSFDDIEKARTILVCGANATENHPIVGARIKQAALHGARLIVVDPRKIELARYAAVHLAPRPGTNVPLLNALACAIVQEGLQDELFLKARVEDRENYFAFISRWPPESVAAVCGIEPNEIRRAARIYATEKPSMAFHGLGLTEHTQGTEAVMCMVNLALLTGNLGLPGTGINPLRGQNNVQGAAQMGCDPGSLTGAIPLDAGRKLFESVWRAPLPAEKGANLLGMMDASLEGKLKALWAIGYDIFLTNPNSIVTSRALESLELVIVQDMFLNETAKRFGTVFFPACSAFEKDGTFMNAERRIQRVRKAIESLGESKSDWEIICQMARAMGKGEFFAYASAEEIWGEVRTVWKAAAGITYPRIDKEGLQWPCPSEDHPGTRILHESSASSGKRFALCRIEYRPTEEAVTQEFPFLLVTGRTLYQFNAGTMTSRTKNSELRPEDTLDISVEDAAAVGVGSGERVRVRSRHGAALLPVRVNHSQKRGELFATFHDPGVFLNSLTSPQRDNVVGTPEYKITAVRIEKLS
ncbi:MAG: formate dehydrogenase subunit alpha [Candidatus Acidiferrales bacterium]